MTEEEMKNIKKTIAERDAEEKLKKEQEEKQSDKE